MKTIAIILLGVWLLAHGLMSLVNFSFYGSSTILSLMAISAGALLIFQRGKITIPGNLGMLLLGLWLTATGLIQLLNLSFTSSGTIMGLIAVGAGLLLLTGR
jgi:hypothetical protein